ncbi:ketopantoate hydroxymethyltransferase [Brevibacillus sp. M2.1A]|uniref:ketopantoate hydroxymethyltransferase n=1 Tax=Brevibacillus sp. M2.1A TaxID=2738980 RepID=UPI00156BCD06|nr:ketopantoate hydroxymethyltransferase [Brevibacillus sp. M2.1A]MCC8435491.1 ketopantoate hydroxymethyltransferase [Brevibacillus sp. M2.1A]
MITDEFLGTVAEFVNSKVAKVVLNQTYEITNFTIKSVQGTVLTIEYMVPTASVSVISLIQIKDAVGGLISENQVYVPVPSDTIITQTVKVRELVGVV